MVYDIMTGRPVELGGVILCRLSFEDADDLADLLNRLDTEQSAAISH